MSAKAVELSTAIVEAINGAAEGTYTIPFTAMRRAVPFDSIEQLKELKVVVFDGPKAAERVTRGRFQRTYKPTLAVLQKLSTGADEPSRLIQSDGLQELVEQIEAVIEDEDNGELAGLSFDGFDEEQDRDPYGFEALKVQGTFISAILLKYTTG